MLIGPRNYREGFLIQRQRSTPIFDPRPGVARVCNRLRENYRPLRAENFITRETHAPLYFLSGWNNLHFASFINYSSANSAWLDVSCVIYTLTASNDRNISNKFSLVPSVLHMTNIYLQWCIISVICWRCVCLKSSSSTSIPTILIHCANSFIKFIKFHQKQYLLHFTICKNIVTSIIFRIIEILQINLCFSFPLNSIDDSIRNSFTQRW